MWLKKQLQHCGSLCMGLVELYFRWSFVLHGSFKDSLKGIEGVVSTESTSSFRVLGLGLTLAKD